jgi:peptidoglycan/xylan/chitin deacetylase (PgdA/CDA1 family)
MKVAVRDDDTCYFTRPETLERVYYDIWDRVPICLATVPFAIGYERTGIPSEHWGSGVPFPLDQNAGIVELLRAALAKGRVTIALHGYTHQDFPDGYEFQAAPDPERRVADGRAYLASALGAPVSIFVPPHNALSKRSLVAVSAAGLNLLGSFLSFRPSMRPWDARTPANWWRVRQYRSRIGRRRTDRFVYPFVLRYTRHAEFGCHSLIPGTTLEELVAGFEEARRAGGHFCLATHYWEIDETMKDVLRRFLDHAARVPEVEFVSCERLFA